MKKRKKRKRRNWVGRWIFIGIMILGAHRICAPPGINADEVRATVQVEEIYADVPNHVDIPLNIAGELMTSCFFGWIGGFYFLRSPVSGKMMIGFTREMPPEDGTWVEVSSVVKPVISSKPVRLLFIKTQRIKIIQTAEWREHNTAL